MKSNLLILLILGLSGPAFAQKDYVSFEAKIENRNRDTIYITDYNRTDKILKTIPINKEGYFKDTLRVSEGLYRFYDRNEVTSLYLKNGYKLNMSLDAKKFDETLKYTGIGARENNFLAKWILTEENCYTEVLHAGREIDVVAYLDSIKQKTFLSLKSSDLDSGFVEWEGKELRKVFLSLETLITKKQSLNKLIGTLTPSFDYENVAGGTTKLENLRGKFVYIDVWATWCGPCIAEIPHLKKIEAKYHDKNITFVGLSIDAKKSREKWRSLIRDKTLGGIQVLADNEWKSLFVQHYEINSIPRFILIDPEGKVVDPDAPRPSSEKLGEQLDELLN